MDMEANNMMVRLGALMQAKEALDPAYMQNDHKTVLMDSLQDESRQIVKILREKAEAVLKAKYEPSL